MERRNTPAAAASVTVAPVLAAVIPTSGPASGGNTVALYGSGFPGATAVRFGAVNATGFTVISPAQINAVAPPGIGTVPVTVTTPGGTSSSTVTYTYVGAPGVPVLAAVEPAQGPVSGGNSVVLTGSGFTGTIVVLFGGSDAMNFTVDSPTRITAVAPAGPAGAASVRVVTPGGVSDPVTYFYTAAPVLSSIAPSQGTVAGGTTVVLTGSGLTTVQAVLFGGNAAAGFTVDSSTRITAVAPAGPAGGGTVQVTALSPAGTGGPIPYTYVAGPVVTSVAPTQGPLYGGTPVTLKGSGLTTTTSVRFGAALAGFTVESDNSVVASAPPGPEGPVQVTVTTPGGTSAPVVYTRVAPPNV